MIRLFAAGALALAAPAAAWAGGPVPPPRDIRPVEARLEPMRGYYPRADRFVPVVAYAAPDDWADGEPFDDGYHPEDDQASWGDE